MKKNLFFQRFTFLLVSIFLLMGLYLFSVQFECTARTCQFGAFQACKSECGTRGCIDYYLVYSECSGPDTCFSLWKLDCWGGEDYFYDCYSTDTINCD